MLKEDTTRGWLIKGLFDNKKYFRFLVESLESLPNTTKRDFSGRIT